jgi:hypothetical protein
VARRPAGRSGAEDLTARAQAWAERSCLDQQLPVKVADRRVLAEVADLLGLPAQTRQTGRRRDSSKRL